MVGWRGGLLLLVALAGLVLYAILSRPQPPPARQPFLPCTGLNTVDVRIEGGGRIVEMTRTTPRDSWALVQPAPAAIDSSDAEYLMNSVGAIKVLNAVAEPQPASTFGLDHPRETLTCRVTTRGSYNLSIGNQSFDGSGYYVRKTGDSRIYVISGVEVDEFDRVLAEPPVKPTPSPTK